MLPPVALVSVLLAVFYHAMQMQEPSEREWPPSTWSSSAPRLERAGLQSVFAVAAAESVETEQGDKKPEPLRYSLLPFPFCAPQSGYPVCPRMRAFLCQMPIGDDGSSLARVSARYCGHGTGTVHGLGRETQPSECGKVKVSSAVAAIGARLGPARRLLRTGSKTHSA